ncbi:MAG: hypothetical protein Q4E83_01840 [bacterium]|nr:hypothetical protein [bacterium]
MRIASINSMSCCKPNLSKRANLREAEQPQIQTPIEPSFKGKRDATILGTISAITGALCLGPLGLLAGAALGGLLGASTEDTPIPGDDDQKDDQNKQIGNNDQK